MSASGASLRIPTFIPRPNGAGVTCPFYDQCGSEPHLLSRLKNLLRLDEGAFATGTQQRDYSAMTRSSSSGSVAHASQQSIAPLLLEIQNWRPLYINNRELHLSGTATRILSELGMAEITITAATGAA